jgi:glycine betaine catabolism A
MPSPARAGGARGRARAGAAGRSGGAEREMATFLKTAASFVPGARTLPREYFTSPAVFEAELERLFHGLWICAGREEEIAEAGEYRLAEVAGESVIVLRDAPGGVGAFYNVCRHRGARVCEAPRGRFSRTIQCPYHAWTYGLDGRLVGAPTMRGCAEFRTEDFPLHPVAAGTWGGFVFINLDGRAEPLEEWLSPLDRLSRFNLADLRSGSRIEYEVAANWKLISQNYSECLHCPTIHPGLSDRTPYASGENDLVEGPLLGGFMLLSEGSGSLTVSGRTCARPVGDLPAEDFERVYYYSVLPNLLVSLHPDYVMCHTLWPEAPDRTRVVCEWLFHGEAAADVDFRPEDAVEFWDRTNREDWRACELSQAGIRSRAYTPGPYSPRESLPAAWDREYLRRMGREK